MKEIAQSENIENFLNKNYIYVDKTEYIYNLLKKYERVFISRPRRFGKSLTLNTIGTLFEKGVDPYFKDTWIHDKWKEKVFPVLHLSFLNYPVNDFDEFKRLICQDFSDFAKEHSFNKFIADKNPSACLKRLLDSIPDSHKIVILIDEYDCQLTANINNPELYEQFRQCLREIYGVLKDREQIRFLAITGVTRLKDVSIFSVGSDILDLTYDSSFSIMIGFTRAEIKKFFIDYLKLGVAYQENISEEDVTDDQVEKLLDAMAEQYDGYCFDKYYEKKVFSTYSVNNFLMNLAKDRRVVFGDYWYEAGGLPSILKNYLDTHELNAEKLLEGDFAVSNDDFLNPTSLITINQSVLMCQTGYLTLKSPLSDECPLMLGIANKEVATALAKLVSAKFMKKDIFVVNAQGKNILKSGTTEEIIELLNSVLLAISYDKYPINNESTLRAMLHSFLMGRNQNVRAESHNAKGRSDLIVDFDKRRVVFEFKFSKDGQDADTKLDEAVSQLASRDYGKENLQDRELLRLACVFNADKEHRTITAYKAL